MILATLHYPNLSLGIGTLIAAIFCVVFQVIIEANKKKEIKTAFEFILILAAVIQIVISQVNLFVLSLVGLFKSRQFPDFDDYMAIYIFIVFATLNSWKLSHSQEDTKIIGRPILALFTVLILGEFTFLVSRL